MSKLKVGDKAPSFTTTDQNGESIALSDLKSKKVILYFYPKDSTPTCTVEACNFRDNHKMLTDKGYVVLGVSADSLKKHQNFANKFKLPFSLLMDMDKTIIEKYGIWQQKNTFGKTYMGIVRTTFVIDEHGIIEQIIDKVKSKIHTEQILNQD